MSTYIVAVLKKSLVRWIPRLTHLRALELYDGNEVDDEVAQQLHACSPKFRALSIFGSVQASYPHSLPCNLLAPHLPFQTTRPLMGYVGIQPETLWFSIQDFWNSLFEVFHFLERQICQYWVKFRTSTLNVRHYDLGDILGSSFISSHLVFVQ